MTTFFLTFKFLFFYKLYGILINFYLFTVSPVDFNVKIPMINDTMKVTYELSKLDMHFLLRLPAFRKFGKLFSNIAYPYPLSFRNIISPPILVNYYNHQGGKICKQTRDVSNNKQFLWCSREKVALSLKFERFFINNEVDLQYPGGGDTAVFTMKEFSLQIFSANKLRVQF